MQKRPFYFAALLALIVAFVLDMQAADFIVKSSRLVKAWNENYAELRKSEDLHTAKGESHLSPPPKPPEIAQFSLKAQRLTQIGMAFDLFGAISLVVAYRRKESGWYFLPILLLIFNVMGIGILGVP
jgi:hypothetical protein